jgi:hypothetical protein
LCGLALLAHGYLSPLIVCRSVQYNAVDAALDHRAGSGACHAAGGINFTKGLKKAEEAEVDDYPASSSPLGLPVIYHRCWKLGIEEVKEWEGHC